MNTEELNLYIFRVDYLRFLEYKRFEQLEIFRVLGESYIMAPLDLAQNFYKRRFAEMVCLTGLGQLGGVFPEELPESEYLEHLGMGRDLLEGWRDAKSPRLRTLDKLARLFAKEDTVEEEVPNFDLV